MKDVSVAQISQNIDNERLFYISNCSIITVERNQTVTNCHQLKMKAADGKNRLTDVANTEDIQSVPSKKVEPFKMWLAEVGRKSIEEETGKPVITNANAQQLDELVVGAIKGISKK